jgi:chaperonin GroES
MRVLGHRLLVRRCEEPEKSSSGVLFIPETAKQRNTMGQVVGLGTGKTCKNGEVVPHDVKVGDFVLYGKFKGDDVIENGEEFLIIDEDELLGVYEDERWRPVTD